MEYYDLVLAGIMASITVSAGIGFVTSVPVNFAVAGGSLPAAALMVHSMFLNAPGGAPGHEAL